MTPVCRTQALEYKCYFGEVSVYCVVFCYCMYLRTYLWGRGGGGELKREKIKRPITVSHFKLELFFGRSGICNVDFSHLKYQSRRHVPLDAVRVTCIWQITTAYLAKNRKKKCLLLWLCIVK